MSTFSRATYVQVAEVIEATSDDTFFEESPEVAFGAALRFAAKFKADNANFDIDRFMVASGFGRNWESAFAFSIERISKEEGLSW